jgi:hypothetical protein
MQVAMDQGAYSRGQLATAVNASALLGWLAAELVVFRGSLFPFTLIVGIPIAFVFCWMVVAPILYRMMQRPVSWVRAAAGGAAISAALASLTIAAFATASWRGSLGGEVGYGDVAQVIDGALTTYGWWLFLQSAVQFVLAGMVAAVVIRAKIGPGVE